MLRNLTKVLLITALLLSSATPALADHDHYPSELVQGITITSPADGATVLSTFTLSGTYRSDLGCNINSGLVTGTTTGSFHQLDLADLKVNPTTGTWSWVVDANKLLPSGEPTIPGLSKIGTGKKEFLISGEARNCASFSIYLTIAPNGGVATGRGGSEFNRYLNQLLGR